MEMISVENHGKVVFAKLNHGTTNALSPKVVKELEAIRHDLASKVNPSKRSPSIAVLPSFLNSSTAATLKV